MKMECEVIRDLLPLYADDACSENSRSLVEEHLHECGACREMLEHIKQTEIDERLQSERALVIRDGARQFRRRSAAVGSAVSGFFMIPILAYLVLNIYTRSALGLFFVVLASLLVAASLILVPILAPQDKFFWTFGAFCASLMILLAVTCLYSRGSWFWIASSATLFGLAVVFLPFLVRTRPMSELIGDGNKILTVLILDGLLFANMMNMIFSRQKMGGRKLMYALCLIICVGVVFVKAMRYKKEKR